MISADQMQAIDESVARSIVSSRRPIRGKELQFFRKICGISLRQLASDIGVKHPTVMNWESEKEVRLDRVVETFVRLYFSEKFQVPVDHTIESLAPTRVATDTIQLTA